MKKNSNLLNLIFLIGICLLHFSLKAQKNDTVYLLNGDRITGEVKKFEYGILTLKTDALQTVSIEYDRIGTVHSAKFFEIRTSAGDRMFGSLAKSHIPATINIITIEDTIPKPIIDIVQMTTIKKSFLKKIDGSVNMGLSYTKASDVFQYNLSSNVSYRTTKYYTNFELSSILTDEKTSDVSRKNDISLGLTRLLPGKWLAGALTKGQQNTELDLAYRWQLGLAMGYDFVRTNSNRLNGNIGLLANQEKTIDSAIVTQNLEGLLTVLYKWFQYRHPKINVTSSLNFFPSLTVANRYRLEYNLDANFEIIKDLFLGVSLYESFDSKPTGGGSGKNDWGVITSIGYTF